VANSGRVVSHRARLVAMCLAALLPLLGGCFLFVGDTADLIPMPEGVTVLQPPQITSCDATFIRRDCDDFYETVCGYFCRRRWWNFGLGIWEWRWGYCCYKFWRYTDCWGDISIKLSVHDPSDDLDLDKAPRVRVFDSEPAPGSGHCLLNVSRTDLPIASTDITGSGVDKTVTVTVRNVKVRFTSDCQTFAASLPLRIVFEDCGEEMASLNECRATIQITKP